MKRTICHQKGGKLAMLQLTRKADYGLRLMLEAAAARDSFVTTRSVAKRQEIPYPFLRRAAAALAEKGLLITARGPQGGVRLAKPASAVTLLDIANAFGGVALNACTEVPARCDRRRTCPAFPAWVEAQAAVDRALAGTDLESLLDRSQPRESTTGTEELLMSGFTGAAACGPDN